MVYEMNHIWTADIISEDQNDQNDLSDMIWLKQKGWNILTSGFSLKMFSL